MVISPPARNVRSVPSVATVVQDGRDDTIPSQMIPFLTELVLLSHLPCWRGDDCKNGGDISADRGTRQEIGLG